MGLQLDGFLPRRSPPFSIQVLALWAFAPVARLQVFIILASDSGRPVLQACAVISQQAWGYCSGRTLLVPRVKVYLNNFVQCSAFPPTYRFAGHVSGYTYDNEDNEGFNPK
ncbi:hypothetical protein B0H19DRAFT_1180653 [Mycena capillaripes]|nr:hypothetical protein B0H19DRAFT_1180653 [Mycena capillaripes]